MLIRKIPQKIALISATIMKRSFKLPNTMEDRVAITTKYVSSALKKSVEKIGSGLVPVAAFLCTSNASSNGFKTLTSN